MADIEDFDLDKTTKQAWDEFTERLADVLSVMDASADLTISAVNGDGDPRDPTRSGVSRPWNRGWSKPPWSASNRRG